MVKKRGGVSIPFWLSEEAWGGLRQWTCADGVQTLLTFHLLSTAAHPTSCCWFWFELWLIFALGQPVGWSWFMCGLGCELLQEWLGVS